MDDIANAISGVRKRHHKAVALINRLPRKEAIAVVLVFASRHKRVRPIIFAPTDNACFIIIYIISKQRSIRHLPKLDKIQEEAIRSIMLESMRICGGGGVLAAIRLQLFDISRIRDRNRVRLQVKSLGVQVSYPSKDMIPLQVVFLNVRGDDDRSGLLFTAAGHNRQYGKKYEKMSLYHIIWIS
jgi:hypothetical protein